MTTVNLKNIDSNALFESFQEHIYESRKTYKEIGKCVGVSDGTISYWLKIGKIPSKKQIYHVYKLHAESQRSK